MFTTDQATAQDAFENNLIVETVEGGWMIFQNEADHETWLNQL